MDLAVGFVLMITGAAVYYRSLVRVLRAHAEVLIPHWRSPDHVPRGATLQRLLGVVVVVLGNAVASPTLGYWGVLILLVLLLPAGIAVIRHNRRVLERA